MTRRRVSTKDRVALFRDSVIPLTPAEAGRGSHLSPERQDYVETLCLAMLREGVTQREMMKLFGATRSRVSRWCQIAIAKSGAATERRLVNTRTGTVAHRFFDRCAIPDGCWLWTGSLKGNGYGSFAWDGKTQHPHRVSYELFVGPIPEGMQIDHICNNPRCVNPRHLSPAWPVENLTYGAFRRRKLCG